MLSAVETPNSGLFGELPNMDFWARTEEYRVAVQAEMREVLSGRPLPLYDMMRYHLGWVDQEGRPVQGSPGKGLRPALCLMACQAVSGRYRPALPVAVALELVHNFSLIHDDIQDDDRQRRHRPTVWSIWGKAQAINAGTAMRILANRALSRLRGDVASPEKRLEIQSRIDEATLRLLEGQYLDIDFERRTVVRLADYLDMVAGKTASLIACALETGAMVGTDQRDAAARFGDMGTALGLAFQIRDDILGIWGDSGQTGKPAGNDIVRKKKTFPMVYALERGGREERERLLGVYSREQVSPADVKEVLSLLERVGALPAAQALVREYSGKARAALDAIGLSEPDRNGFEEIIQIMAERSA